MKKWLKKIILIKNIKSNLEENLFKLKLKNFKKNLTNTGILDLVAIKIKNLNQ